MAGRRRGAWRDLERAALERIRKAREAADAARATGSGRLRVLGREAKRLNSRPPKNEE